MLPHLPTFWLHFYCKGAGIEWIDEGLPIPNYLEYANKGYFVGWQVEGYFGTQNATDFLNDIIGRVIITLKDTQPQRLPWKPDIKTADHYYPKIYKLRQISTRAKSLPSKRNAPDRATNFDDYVFWAIKLHVEDCIREQGEGLPIVYESLQDWALGQFERDQSTIRAKCASIWKWYDAKGWTLPKGRKGQMTRKERAISNSKKMAEEAKRKVANTLTGMFSEDYKTGTGKWNISKIAKELQMSRDTVRKYIREIEVENMQEIKVEELNNVLDIFLDEGKK